jgi:hypothetical protein
MRIRPRVLPTGGVGEHGVGVVSGPVSHRPFGTKMILIFHPLHIRLGSRHDPGSSLTVVRHTILTRLSWPARRYDVDDAITYTWLHGWDIHAV